MIPRASRSTADLAALPADGPLPLTALKRGSSAADAAGGGGGSGSWRIPSFFRRREEEPHSPRSEGGTALLPRRHSADCLPPQRRGESLQKLDQPRLMNENNEHVTCAEPPQPHAHNEERTQRQREPPPPRRPSIPSSIHPLDLSMASAASDDGASSIVSEMTLMTYSDEKAELIKEEFFRRLRKRTKELQRECDAKGQGEAAVVGMEEREEMLREAAAAQEANFRRERELQRRRKRREAKAADDGGGNAAGPAVFAEDDFFDRLASLRSQARPGEEKAPTEEEAIMLAHNEIFCRLNSLRLQKEAASGELWLRDADENAGVGVDDASLDAGGEASNDGGGAKRGGPSPRKAGSRRASLASGPTPASSRRSSLAESFNSLATAKHHNQGHPSSSQNWPQDDDDNLEPGLHVVQTFGPGLGQPTGEMKTIPESRSRSTLGEESTLAKSEGSSTLKPTLDEVIELKLLVANQQATIDTLRSRLHNLEVANRQLERDGSGRMREAGRDDAALDPILDRNRALERENAELRRQVEELRGRPCLDGSKRSAGSRRGGLVGRFAGGGLRRGSASTAPTPATSESTAGGDSP